MAASWQIRDSVLGIQQDDGSFSVPSAQLVFLARFGDTAADSSLPRLDQNEATRLGIQFERYPCDLRLSVRTSPSKRGRLSLLLTTRTRDGDMGVDISRATEGGHAIINNRWVYFAPHHLEELSSILALIGTEPQEGLTLRQYLQVRLASTPNGILEFDGGLQDTQSLDVEQPLASGTSVVEPLLYPYQRAGFAWMRQLGEHEIGGILADEMGLGKTIQLIALIDRRHSDSAGTVLIIGTLSILENWRRELARFAPRLSVLVHHGSDRTGSPAALRNFDVVVISYDTLVRDSVILSQVAWDLVVADEAQFLKNPSTLRSQSARRLHSHQIIASTGTPVENSLRDLWSLTDLVVPGLLGDLGGFVASFPDEPSAATRLAEITAPVVLRRRIAQVAGDLPPRIDIPTPLLFSDQEASDYDRLRQSLLGGAAGASFGALTKLRMYCAHPLLLSQEDRDPAELSVKYSRFIEVISEILNAEEKVLVFASFKRMIDIIRDDLVHRFGVHSTAIDGRTPVVARQAAIDSFTAVSGCAVLVLNPRAAGAGLNITAANHVIHYTLEWNPAVEDQATARAYRLGQTRPVTVHRLFYADSVDEVMNERLERKRDLISLAIARDNADAPDTRDLMAALNRSPRRGPQRAED